MAPQVFAMATFAIAAVAAPAVAGTQGWYLLVPLSTNVDAPVSQWQQVGSYDTASACEDERSKVFASSKERLERQEGGDSDFQRWLFGRFLSVRCISAADPRLAPRSTK